MKVTTWNINSLNVRLPQVLAWLAAEQPDVLALQETKLVDEKFPRAEIEAAGYCSVYAGQKTYNGVALLSRQPAQDVVSAIPGFDDAQRRVLAATFNGVRVLNLYVPNGESVESDKYRYKLDWLAALTAWMQQQLATHPRLVVLGDFNIAPEPRDVHDPKQWEGHVLFSQPERVAFRQLLATGLCDTFRLFEQPDKSFTWWDYRMQGFRRNHGLRIDHILASAALCQACTSCRIDQGPRAHERPSDHAPVVAEYNV
ncbi:MAG TPA: exodeoxyribonuclease III [Acidiferrobacterales bacterium]|nr:exodeoxyribonuclease III [Acidiferrobacterales bacterium]